MSSRCGGLQSKAASSMVAYLIAKADGGDCFSVVIINTDRRALRLLKDQLGMIQP